MIKRPKERRVFVSCGVICVDGKLEMRCPVPVTPSVDVYAGTVSMPPSLKLRGYDELGFIQESVNEEGNGEFYVGFGLMSVGPVVVTELTVQEFREALAETEWEVVQFGSWGSAEPTVLIP